MRFQKIRVCLKELNNKSLERNKIHVGVRVEELEVDLNSALLNEFQGQFQKKTKKQRQQPSLIRCPFRPLLCVLVSVLALSTKG
jgi:hypothetical protein